MELTAEDLWSRVLRAAEQHVAEQSHRTWLAGTHAVAITETELLVDAPSPFHVEWIEAKFGALLAQLLEQVRGRPLRLSLRASASGSPPIPTIELSEPPVERRSEPEATPFRDLESPLNERYTFERFVVGDNNQLAAAACMAVAEQPARRYNPLFLYGGVGLGKTHLMHAIGNRIQATYPTMRVAYVSSERFMNELVTSIQQGTAPEFRLRYRRMDLLLVDDVHFLEGKERTQEEFFHTFNALYDAQKQIVLTSDRPPKEIPGLEARLISRFEWGLVADIKPPDYETRVAILRKKASDDGLVLDHDVIDYIARSCHSSVRELEGAVIKLLAYSSLTHREIDEELARTALLGMVSPEKPKPRVTPMEIRSAVAAEWGVTPEALVSKRRTRDLTVPRQIAMYLIKDLLDHSLVQIGAFFGGRDHSTVIHSVRKVEHGLLHDPAFNDRVEQVRSRILGGTRRDSS